MINKQYVKSQKLNKRTQTNRTKRTRFRIDGRSRARLPKSRLAKTPKQSPLIRRRGWVHQGPKKHRKRVDDQSQAGTDLQGDEIFSTVVSGGKTKHHQDADNQCSPYGQFTAEADGNDGSCQLLIQKGLIRQRSLLSSGFGDSGQLSQASSLQLQPPVPWPSRDSFKFTSLVATGSAYYLRLANLDSCSLGAPDQGRGDGFWKLRKLGRDQAVEELHG